ncbi:2415_t:CDS:2, partial [Funneliformis geosporum]
ASKLSFAIEFNKKTLDKDSEKYQMLYNGMKKVLKMIIRMLINRACVEEEPEKKRAMS